VRGMDSGPTPRVVAIPKPYTLYVGNAYPHKNLDALVAGFAAYRQNGFADRTLVLVGASDYFYERLKRETELRKLAEHVIFFGQASDAELTALYLGAESYVFPSLCEGFGLPPLEAMANGLPVASSNASCLPEILGDAARYFNPTDSASMVKALKDLATDAALRATLKAKGHTQAGKYDWRACAEKTLIAYNKAHE